MEGLLFQPAQRVNRKDLKVAAVIVAVAVIGVAAVIAVNNSSSRPQITSDLIEHQEFKNYLQLHNKQYSSLEEYQYRLSVFKDNSELIRAHNSMNEDVVLAANKFADLTNAEFKALYTHKIEAQQLTGEFNIHESYEAPPPAVDWRDQGAVTDVKDQTFACHASWAFAAVGAAEGAWKVAGHDLKDLSVQQPIDCQTLNNNCKNGTLANGMSYILQNGLESDLVYPYYAKYLGSCLFNSSYVVATFKNVTQVTPNNTAMFISAIASQPVATSVEADQYVWQFYSTGVIYKFCGTNINHNVLAVGYNITAGYTINKNSWGPEWGESGYVRIGIGGASPGVCGININPIYTNAN